MLLLSSKTPVKQTKYKKVINVQIANWEKDMVIEPRIFFSVEISDCNCLGTSRLNESYQKNNRWFLYRYKPSTI